MITQSRFYRCLGLPYFFHVLKFLGQKEQNILQCARQFAPMAVNGIWPLSRSVCVCSRRAVVVTNGLEARSDSCHGRVRPRDTRRPQEGAEKLESVLRESGVVGHVSSADMLGLGSVRRDENWPFDGREQRNPPRRCPLKL